MITTLKQNQQNIITGNVVNRNSLKELIKELPSTQRVMVLPIVNGLEVKVIYKNGVLEKVESSGMKLSLSLVSKLLPKNLRYLTDVTFNGFLYIPIDIYEKVNSQRASNRFKQHASVIDVVRKILFNDQTVEDALSNSLKIVLVNFMLVSKNDPSNWTEALSSFALEKLPFAEGLSFFMKEDLLYSASSKSPYAKDYNVDYETLGISIYPEIFSSKLKINSYNHYYGVTPLKLRVNNITWEMTTDGRLVPYVIYEEDSSDRHGMPIKVLRKISLHNPKWVMEEDTRKVLKTGDEVYVGKGPDGLRYIQDIDYEKREEFGDTQDYFDLPEECPYCHSSITDRNIDEDGNIYCKNPLCFERITLVSTTLAISILMQERRYKAVDSINTMRQKILKLWAENPKEFEPNYKESDDGYSEDTILYPYSVMMKIPEILGLNKSIDKKKVENIPLSIFVMGLGVNGLTEELANEISKVCWNLDQFRDLQLKVIEKIDGMQSNVALSLFRVLNDEFYFNIFDAMTPYIEDRTKEIQVEYNYDRKHLDSDVKKLWSRKVVLFDGLNFLHYREISEFLESMGAYIAKSYMDPTTGINEMYYSYIEAGKSTKVDINMNSDKTRERIHYIITGSNPSSFVTQIELKNEDITDKFRDSDNQEKLLSMIVIIMTEDEMVEMIRNYRK